MTMTLRGRLETRLLLLLVIALPWTLAVAPLLPRPDSMTLEAMYRMLLAGLGVVAVASMFWELVYHALQQLRWDRDWPSVFMLLTVASEGALAWLLLHELNVIEGSWSQSAGLLPAFAWSMGGAWIAAWLFMQGPMRVLLPRWRYEGGCVLFAPAASYARRAVERADADASF